MKCDGTQPICNQCVRFERARLCEFNTGPFPSINKTLEQRIARLELLISELERDDPNLVKLHDPYSDYRSSEGTPTNCTSSRAVTASVKWWETVDPPERIRHELVQGFLVHAQKFGFFLDEERFQSAFNSPSVCGSRPPSVLRNAVYVWGINLSGSPEYASKEHVFLGRAIRGLHPALASAQRQGGSILMVLQTEILLSQYFFHCNRLLEGRYHASAAMSLAILCDLHRGLPADIAQARLPPPADAVEEAERRRGWWAALTLDKTWVVALSPPSTLEPANDTEGPSVSGRRSGVHNCPLHPSSPHRLVKGPPSSVTIKAELDRRPSPLAWLAEASLLYDQAHHLASSPPNNIEHGTRLATLSNTIEKFAAQLPQLGHIDKMSQGEAEAHNLVLSLCLCHCAMIQLHYPLVSRSPVFIGRCLTAARAVVQMLGGVAQRIRVMNPIVGVLAMTAAEALLLDLQVVRVKVSSEYHQLFHSMKDLAAATQALNQYPFIAVQTQRLREVASYY